MMIKLGVVSGLWWYAGCSSGVELLQRVHSLGVRYVGFQGAFAGNPARLSMPEKRAICAERAARDMVIANFINVLPYNMGSATAAESDQNVAYFRQAMEFAQMLGCNQMLVNAGQWAPGHSRADVWPRAVNFLQGLAETAKADGVYLALETEPYVSFLVNDMRSTRRMLDDVGSAHLLTLPDTGHMALAREAASDLLPVAETVIHAHFSDHELLRHTNQILGSGAVDTRYYLDALEAIDAPEQARRYDQEFAILVELGMPGVNIPDPEDWARRSLAHAQKIAPELSLE